MVTEQIRLVGGPRDGEVLEWCGRDVVLFHLVSVPTGLDNVIKPSLASIEYRRSTRSVNLFVFQP